MKGDIADPATVHVAWTVTNLGTGLGRTLAWTDRIVYSTNDVIGDSDDVVLGNVAHGGGLAVGASYSGSIDYRFGPAFISAELRAYATPNPGALAAFFGAGVSL